jgi:hypothetical protein
VQCWLLLPVGLVIADAGRVRPWILLRERLGIHFARRDRWSRYGCLLYLVCFYHAVIEVLCHSVLRVETQCW